MTYLKFGMLILLTVLTGLEFYKYLKGDKPSWIMVWSAICLLWDYCLNLI